MTISRARDGHADERHVNIRAIIGPLTTNTTNNENSRSTVIWTQPDKFSIDLNQASNLKQRPGAEKKHNILHAWFSNLWNAEVSCSKRYIFNVLQAKPFSTNVRHKIPAPPTSSRENITEEDQSYELI